MYYTYFKVINIIIKKNKYIQNKNPSKTVCKSGKS